ncbi:hypothetical protein HS125_11935 [bacterium]|nr:hypothetical protein [bacterium]
MAAPVVRVMGEGEGLPGPAQKCWRRLRRRLEVLRGVERLVKGLRLPLGLSFDALLLLALLLWAEIRLHPAPILRWTLAACAAVLLLLQLRRRLRAAWRGISSLLDSAQRLDRERRHHDRLTAAVSLAGESRDVLAQFSPPLLLQLYREAERDARRLWLLSLSAWRAAFFELAGIAALVAAAWYLPYYTPYTFPDLWGRYTARLISPHAPAPVQLAVSPGHLSFRKGEPVEIAAAVVGEIAAPPVLVFRSLSVDWERLLMRETDSKGRYGRTLSGLTSRFEYFVEASRLKSPVYQGTPIETVALRNLRIETLPPPYASSLPQPVEADAGEIALTEGGRIAWTVELEEPARRVVWQYLVEAGPGPAAERADLRAATYLAPVWGWLVGSQSLEKLTWRRRSPVSAN